MSPNADCAECRPSHPFRVHFNGKTCLVPLCPCMQFRLAAPKPPTTCPICGGPAHASGRCARRFR
jgi:hypothetical protein